MDSLAITVIVVFCVLGGVTLLIFCYFCFCQRFHQRWCEGEEDIVAVPVSMILAHAPPELRARHEAIEMEAKNRVGELNS